MNMAPPRVVATDLDGEFAPHLLDVGLERVPHEVDRRLIRAVEIALQRLVHHPRAGTGVAVVQIDDRAIELVIGVHDGWPYAGTGSPMVRPFDRMCSRRLPGLIAPPSLITIGAM